MHLEGNSGNGLTGRAGIMRYTASIPIRNLAQFQLVAAGVRRMRRATAAEP